MHCIQTQTTHTVERLLVSQVQPNCLVSVLTLELKQLVDQQQIDQQTILKLINSLSIFLSKNLPKCENSVFLVFYDS